MNMFLDTLLNLVTGLGTSKDKHTGNQFAFAPMNQAEQANAYRGDWIARKVVDIPAEDATREWRQWQGDREAITDLEAEEERHNIKGKVEQGLQKARLQGGALGIIGVRNQKWDQPLNLDAVKKGDLEYFHVVDRWEVAIGEIDRDVLSPNYGLPAFYRFTSDSEGAVKIHPSRVVRFMGKPLPMRSLDTDSWGDSILDAIRDAITNAALGSQSVARILNEATVDVVKVPDFMQNVGTDEYRTRMTQRFQLANVLKGITNALVLDQNEEWETRTPNFQQLPEIVRVYLNIAAGAGDIPATRLLGQSPGGLNATGESDVRNYYDMVGAQQRNKLQPAMKPLDEVLIRSALGTKPDGLFYRWLPLWQPTEGERADILLKRSQSLALIVQTGLVPDEPLGTAAQNMLIEDGTFPGLEDALEEWALTEPDETDPEVQNQFQQGQQQPPPPPPPNGGQQQNGDPAARGTEEQQQQATAEGGEPIDDAKLRPLYVSRQVQNAAALIAWAKEQGIDGIFPADSLHVTVTYSRTPVDWFAMGEAWQAELTIAAGGPRDLELMGTTGRTLVLRFASHELNWRHRSMIEQGASWDWPEYAPHISIAKLDMEPGGVPPIDIDALEPYTGEIILGPEMFEPIDPERA